MRPTNVAFALLCLTAPLTPAADWPTYQHDNARSGVTTERIAPPLALRWVFASPHPPARGWPEPERGAVWSYGVERIAKTRREAHLNVVACSFDRWLWACSHHPDSSAQSQK